MKGIALSNIDTAWRRMEDPTNLMMSSGLLIFDESVNLERLKGLLEERLLAAYPRFTMKVVESPLGIAPPSWVPDEDFDINAHVHRVALPAPGDRAELQSLVSDLISTPLDFTKPPWHIHLIENVEGGCAVLARVHHCIADGIALVHVLFELTDASAIPPRKRATGERTAAQASRRSIARQVVGAGFGLVAHPLRLIEAGATGAAAVTTVARLTAYQNDPRSVLKGRLGVSKQAAISDPIALTEVKEVAALFDATVNDVITAVVAGGLGRYLRGRGEDTERIAVRAAVPFNLRAGDPAALGNRFGLVFVPLPTDEEKSVARVRQVKREMGRIKASLEPGVSMVMLGGFGLLPSRVYPTAINFFGQKVSLTLTNVPGPKAARYLAGRRIANVMFWAPVSGHLGLGISVMSYNGAVTIGAASDKGLIPDPDTLVREIHNEWVELRREISPVSAPVPPEERAPRPAGRRAPSRAR